MFPSLLIVDDEPSILQTLGGLLTDEGFEVITAANGYEALKKIENESPDLVLLDIWMPGIDGIETLKEIKKAAPYIPVIIITGHGTIETAVRATKLGAFDLIEKPLSIDKVLVSIHNALNFRRLEEENRYLRKKTIEKHSVTGNSPRTLALKSQIAAAAPSDAWILIKGENGTGKELVARNIHHLSPRADQPLIEVNCAAIPEELIESELFGHEKGAFTEATIKKRGKLELANNGTLFLDEIGDMSLKTQGKILRVLQEQKFQRVGGGRTLTVDVRVIAATSKDLSKEIREGNFREELYYRLNVIPIEVPALRDRIEDLPALVEIFLAECAKQNKARRKMSPAALALLQRYPWPGNVRELKNLVERLAIVGQSEVIDVGDLPALYNPQAPGSAAAAENHLFAIDNLAKAKSAFERAYLHHKLTQHDHDLAETARAIGMKAADLGQLLKNTL
ncbi:MAG: sigma-54 dependent transcriptional regulator [Desulfobacterales bacterium]|nr:sigma-54 dependent transcriptional regulator [Desulfobacterales bacterium]